MNSSEGTNVTTADHVSSGLEQAEYSMAVASIILFSIGFVIGIPGNAFVIWVAGVKMKKTVNTIWYVNLAVADLLCCLIIPFIMSEVLLDYHWPYGAAMCKLLYTVVYLNMFASVFTLTLISLDRFALVIWPTWAQNHRSIFGARLLCGLAWFLAVLLSLPELIYHELEMEGDNKSVCEFVVYQLDHGAVQAIDLTSALFGFLVPLLVMTGCYLLIARRMRARRIKSQKALRIMVGVVTAFFICWLPYHTVYLVLLYGDKSSEEVAWAVDPLATSLACFNSCLNPVLYVFMGQDFKEKAKLSLRRIFENTFSEDVTRSLSSQDTALDKIPQ